MARKQTSELEIDVARIEEREKANAEWKKEVNSNFKKLNKKVDDLPELLIEKLDERYASKKEVEELQETVAPITTFRRKIWAWIVFVVFALGVIETLIFNYMKDHIK